MQIVDTHHHLWDLKENYYPWLTDRIEKKPYGDYSAICRNYLIEDFFADIDNLNVVKSVHINADHDHSDPVRESAWLQSIADDVPRSRGFPHGIVADANLLGDDLPVILERHCAFRNMRGIRSILSPIVTAGKQDILEDDRWWKGLDRIRQHRLSLDLQIHPVQMNRIADAARKNPGLQFIICHTGFVNYNDRQMLETWSAGMTSLAGLPNVALKISGFMVWDLQWTAAKIRPIVLQAIDMFGVARCMFGSNFPPDRLARSYRYLWDAYDEITRDFAVGEREALFAGNAYQYYRL